ncbi:serine/threonine-protein kinase BLUS1-like [Magnolia sinica]|uniref:serine/threonine-protein kinase BLUS1-like n=1 Tax=Magnolia sinica TaxID=86752 RepID=UPI00265ABB96|nr:serine/threonine-protein kinase BLUS1-like [Magnolia sinica]
MAYSLNCNGYLIFQQINTGVSTIVYKATCLNLKSVVVIKAFNGKITDKKEDIDLCSWTIDYLSYTNFLKPNCFFRVDNKIWVVMPFMSYHSLRSISSSFPKGISETYISIILKETLRALSYLHSEGVVHRDIKADNIFFDSNGSVKLAYFGESAAHYQEISSYSVSFLSSFNDLNGMPYWMTPEVIYSTVEDRFMSNDVMSDIWIFSITALELAHGCPLLSHRPSS